MFVDDPLEDGRVASAIPRPFRIYDRDRAALANAKAVRLGAQDPAGLGQAQLLETSLEKVPSLNRSIAVAALRIGLISAQKYVAAGGGYAHGCGKLPESWQFVGWHMIKRANA